MCLLGNEHGAQDAQGISSTEREFREATKQGKTRLFFIKADNDQNRHRKTVDLIKKTGGEMICRRFSNVTELVTQVYAAFVQYLEDENACLKQALIT